MQSTRELLVSAPVRSCPLSRVPPREGEVISWALGSDRDRALSLFSCAVIVAVLRLPCCGCCCYCCCRGRRYRSVLKSILAPRHFPLSHAPLWFHLSKGVK